MVDLEGSVQENNLLFLEITFIFWEEKSCSKNRQCLLNIKKKKLLGTSVFFGFLLVSFPGVFFCSERALSFRSRVWKHGDGKEIRVLVLPD